MFSVAHHYLELSCLVVILAKSNATNAKSVTSNTNLKVSHVNIAFRLKKQIRVRRALTIK